MHFGVDAIGAQATLERTRHEKQGTREKKGTSLSRRVRHQAHILGRFIAKTQPKSKTTRSLAPLTAGGDFQRDPTAANGLADHFGNNRQTSRATTEGNEQK